MAVVATGGYGRGLMAPESDIDLLFILPYKQTAWGEQVAEAILYCLWDMGLKVGHATRSVDESIRQARGDMTIRTAILETRFLTGDQPLYDELVDAVRQGSRAGHRGRIRHRQARRARGAASPRRAIALSGRAQRQGRQGRPARPAHAVLDREICLPRARDRRAAGARRVRRAGIPHLPPLRRFPVVGPLQHPFLLRPRRRAAVVRHAARDRDPARLHLASRHAGCRTLHEALLPGRQGRRRPHRDPVRQAGRPAGQARAGAEPHDGAAAAEHQPAAGARQRRFHRRQQPHQSRRARRLQARPGQSDPDLPAGAEEQPRLPPRRDAHGDALAEADQHAAARKSRSQPAVHGDPDVERRRDRAAADERDRRARPFHPRLRQDRVDDAVQHVPPLYGGRASVALRRLPAGHRARRQRRVHRRQRPDAQDPPRAPRGDLHHHAAARHRQGPARGSLDRRRQGGAAAVPAARLQRRRYRAGGLADRGASDDVDGGAIARPLRPQDHREFRRRGAVGRADEAADDPDHRRHPRRRPRRLERLEGAAAAHAVLRDRAGADRRLLGSEPRAAHRGGAGGIPRRLHRMAGSRSSTPISRGTIRPTGSRSSCRARSATPASCAPANRPATSSRSMSASTRRAASPN